MTHATRFVAVVAVLAALAVGAPVQAQTPEIDALRVRAEAGDAEAQNNLALRYDFGQGVPEDDAEAVWWYRLAADQGHAEEYISRAGTDHGREEKSFESKLNDVLRQIESGDVRIVYDPRTESANLIAERELAKYRRT